MIDCVSEYMAIANAPEMIAPRKQRPGVDSAGCCALVTSEEDWEEGVESAMVRIDCETTQELRWTGLSSFTVVQA